jgi:hypothetical protein
MNEYREFHTSEDKRAFLHEFMTARPPPDMPRVDAIQYNFLFLYGERDTGTVSIVESVAQEVFEQIERLSYSNIESPKEDKYNLGLLVDNIYKKIIRTGKSIFIPEGIKKMNENAYIIKFGLKGAGLEAPDGQRVEQNQTMISYDESSGTIRVANYNIESPVGGKSSWRLKPNDLDLYFFPTQDRDEISETIAVHMKYY